MNTIGLLEVALLQNEVAFLHTWPLLQKPGCTNDCDEDVFPYSQKVFRKDMSGSGGGMEQIYSVGGRGAVLMKSPIEAVSLEVAHSKWLCINLSQRHGLIFYALYR